MLNKMCKKKIELESEGKADKDCVDVKPCDIPVEWQKVLVSALADVFSTLWEGRGRKASVFLSL